MRAVLAAMLLVAPVAVAAQSRTAQLLQAARQHISANQLDSADAELRAALDAAFYPVDSATVYVWRGVLEHVRGSDSLARASFRQAFALKAGFSTEGLARAFPDVATMLDAEARAARVYVASNLDDKPAWRSGPGVAYPRDVRRRRVAGLAVVTAVVDTLGRVEPGSVQVLETPDSGLVEPLKQMMLATTFTPGRVRGRPVRSQTSLGFNLTPPPLGNPTQLVTA
ncbi:MAG TPA: hypothetical protein VGQ06_10550, partial [Gemmatimonadales bacterium]|nr:hypothetical protein [Gemmatimonadales bacterium]